MIRIRKADRHLLEVDDLFVDWEGSMPPEISVWLSRGQLDSVGTVMELSDCAYQDPDSYECLAERWPDGYRAWSAETGDEACKPNIDDAIAWLLSEYQRAGVEAEPRVSHEGIESPGSVSV